jgi:hypothetical protein
VLLCDPYLLGSLRLSVQRALFSRISAAHQLAPLPRDLLAGYLRWHLSRAGVDRDIFQPAAIDLLAEAAEGNPRTLNLLAQAAWLAAARQRAQEILPEHVHSSPCDRSPPPPPKSPPSKLPALQDPSSSTAAAGGSPKTTPVPNPLKPAPNQKNNPLAPQFIPVKIHAITATRYKKNWLFVGSPEAGHRSAVIYTLLMSARNHGVDPKPTCGP